LIGGAEGAVLVPRDEEVAGLAFGAIEVEVVDAPITGHAVAFSEIGFGGEIVEELTGGNEGSESGGEVFVGGFVEGTDEIDEGGRDRAISRWFWA
jgi:hypothetical protein